MGAPKGNEFWKLRSKHGRDKLFASPELMLKAACEYFQWCVDNPWARNELIRGGDLAGQVIAVETSRPFTLEGLCRYLNCDTSYFRKFEDNNHNSKDFITVITHIREAIYQQKFEGAAVGAFNANIIARDLGLQDHKKVEDINPKDHGTIKLPDGTEIKL